MKTRIVSEMGTADIEAALALDAGLGSIRAAARRLRRPARSVFNLVTAWPLQRRRNRGPGKAQGGASA